MPHITPAHLHVLVNHIPVIGVPVVMLFLAWGFFRREEAVLRAALIGAVILGACTWFTSYTGDAAKDDIRHLSWFRKDVVQEHEESADYVEMAAIATAVVAAAGLFMSRGGRGINRRLALVVMLMLLFTTTVAARTSWLGGKIRHDEFGLTPGAPSP